MIREAVAKSTGDAGGETYDHDTADDPPAEGEEEEEVETDQLVGVDEKDIE